MTPPQENPFEAPDSGDLKLIMYRLGQVEEGQRKLEAGQAEILDELRRVPRCPNPGLCNVLREQVEEFRKLSQELSARVRSLEDDKARVQGASWATRIIWGLLVSLFTSGVAGLVYMVAKHVSN